MSLSSTLAGPRALRARTTRTPRTVPWSTVLPFAVVMAYADGFWITTMRGAVGAIERTQGPFASWLRESTVVLPVFVFAVLGAVTLALRWLGSGRRWTVPFTALLVAVAGTAAGLAEVAVSSAYDYHLQMSQLKMMYAMHSVCTNNCLSREQHATLALQLHAFTLAGGLLVVTNLVLVAWMTALLGGRLKLTGARRPSPVDRVGPSAAAWRTRLTLPVLVAAAGLIGSAAIHVAVTPAYLRVWPVAGVFLMLLTAADVAAARLLLVRPGRAALRTAAVVAALPLLLWLYTRTVGLPFGPGSGVRQSFGLADGAVALLEIASLIAIGARLVRRRPDGPLTPHARTLVVIGALAATVVGLGGTGVPWLDLAGSSGQAVMTMVH